uniref:Oxidation resistance protein 1 n=1 Tax=Ganoderma boninense TaxID=34458 RepID=A0A5K1K3Y6_9APHY|nr:Transcription factor MBP1 [Ganoderma boninense]
MSRATAQQSSPIHISPLIPLQIRKGEDKEDLFATLFSPPTPRASPTRTPEPNSGWSARHARQESTDSEFGAFVSVPATEDPLRLADGPNLGPYDSQQNYEFFDKFTEDAKAASEKRRSQVLDELLQHEDDPLYWLQGMSSVDAPASTTTPQSSQHASAIDLSKSVGDSLIDLESPSETNRSLVPSASSSSPEPSSLPKPIAAYDRSLSDDDIEHLDDALNGARPSRQRTHTSPPAVSAAERSFSLPPSSPTRPADPQIQRTQPSYFTPQSIPSRWVSNFLSSTIRGTRTSPPTPPAESSIASLFASISEEPLPSSSSRFSTLSQSAPHSRAPTHFESAPPSVDSAITHGTPFGLQPYKAPSGAPGFAGDRMWDKGFEFNKAQVERQSVRLTGRREMTGVVLTVEIADMLRPFLPALARLPKQWTLLYSLDQHGISLNTLYARCQDFKGSTVFVVRDSGERVFGAWMGEGIHPSKGGYYGSGESFLWQMTGKDHLRVFKWTGRNDYVALCEPDYISFGGGDGRYGLWLDESLIDGSSARCLTFGNEPLCSAGPRKGDTVTFECVGLEVWGIG